MRPAAPRGRRERTVPHPRQAERPIGALSPASSLSPGLARWHADQAKTEPGGVEPKWLLCGPCGAPNARDALSCGVCAADFTALGESLHEQANLDGSSSGDAADGFDDSYSSISETEDDERAVTTFTSTFSSRKRASGNRDDDMKRDEADDDDDAWSCFVPGSHRRAVLALCALTARRRQRQFFARWKRKCAILGEAELTWECLDVLHRVEALNKLHRIVSCHQRHLCVRVISRLRLHARESVEREQTCLDKLERALALQARARMRFAFAKLSTAGLRTALSVYRLCRCFAALDKAQNRTLRSAFGQWKQHCLRAERCEQLGRILCWASRSHQRRALATVFSRLRHVVHHAAAIERLARIVKRRRLSQALDRLRCHQERVEAIERLCKGRARRSAAEVLKILRTRLVKVRVVHKMLRAWKRVTMRTTFRRLARYASARARQATAISRLCNTSRRSSVASAFRQWARDARLLQVSEDLGRARVLARFMRAWRRASRISAAASSFRASSSQKAISTVFSTWRIHARVETATRQRQAVTSVFYAWKIHARSIRRARLCRLARIMHVRQRSSLRHAWNAWQGRESLHASTRRVLCNLALMWRRHRLRDAWRLLARRHAITKERILAACAFRLAQTYHDRKYRAFTTWTRFVQLEAWKEKTALQGLEKARAAAESRFWTYRQGRAFSLWRLRVVSRPHALARCAKRAARSAQHLAFKVWRRALEAYWARRDELRMCFLFWQSVARLNAASRSCVERLLARVGPQALQQWQNLEDALGGQEQHAYQHFRPHQQQRRRNAQHCPVQIDDAMQEQHYVKDDLQHGENGIYEGYNQWSANSDSRHQESRRLGAYPRSSLGSYVYDHQDGRDRQDCVILDEQRSGRLDQGWEDSLHRSREKRVDITQASRHEEEFRSVYERRDQSSEYGQRSHHERRGHADQRQDLVDYRQRYLHEDQNTDDVNVHQHSNSTLRDQRLGSREESHRRYREHPSINVDRACREKAEVREQQHVSSDNYHGYRNYAGVRQSPSDHVWSNAHPELRGRQAPVSEDGERRAYTQGGLHAVLRDYSGHHDLGNVTEQRNVHRTLDHGSAHGHQNHQAHLSDHCSNDQQFVRDYEHRDHVSMHDEESHLEGRNLVSVTNGEGNHRSDSRRNRHAKPSAALQLSHQANEREEETHRHVSLDKQQLRVGNPEQYPHVRPGGEGAHDEFEVGRRGGVCDQPRLPGHAHDRARRHQKPDYRMLEQNTVAEGQRFGERSKIRIRGTDRAEGELLADCLEPDARGRSAQALLPPLHERVGRPSGLQEYRVGEEDVYYSRGKARSRQLYGPSRGQDAQRVQYRLQHPQHRNPEAGKVSLPRRGSSAFSLAENRICCCARCLEQPGIARRDLARAFCGWRAWVSARHKALLKVLWPLTRSSSRELTVQSCFTRWQVQSTALRHQSVRWRSERPILARSALLRVLSSRVRRFWMRWVRFTLRRVLQSAQDAALAHSMLVRWSRAVVLHRARKRQLAQLVGRLEHRAINAAWDAWATGTIAERQKDLEQLWENNLCLQRVLAGWRQVCQQSRANAGMKHLRDLAGTFVCWRMQTRAKAHADILLADRCFNAWALWSLSRRQQRLDRTFCAWRAWAQLQRASRRTDKKLTLQFRRHRVALLRRTLCAAQRGRVRFRLARHFRIWARSAAHAAQVSRAIGRLFRTCRSILLRRGWSRLQSRAHANHQLRSMLQRTRVRMHRNAVRWAFHQWKFVASVCSVQAWYTAEQENVSASLQLVTSAAVAQMRARDTLAAVFTAWELEAKVGEATRRTALGSDMAWMERLEHVHSLRANFRVWALHVRGRICLRHAILHWVARDKSAALRRLRSFSQRVGNVHRFAKLVALRFGRLALRRSFGRWRRRAEQLARLEKARRFSRQMRAAKRIVSQSRFQIGLEICHRVTGAATSARLARAWRVLRDFCRRRAILERALWRWRRSSLRESFARWMRHLREHRALHRIARIRDRQLAARAWMLWKSRFRIAKQVTRAVREHDRLRCRFAFLRWSRCAQKCSLRRAAVERFTADRMHKGLRRILRVWGRQAHAARVRRMAALRSRLRESRLKKLRNSLGRWRARVALSRRLEALACAQSRTRMRRFFLAWVQESAQQQQRRKALQRLGRMRRDLLKACAVRGWRDSAFMAHSLRARALRRVLWRVSIPSMQRAAFEIWVAHIVASRRKEDAQEASRLQRASSAFANWKASTHKSRSIRRWLCALRTRRVRAAFVHWERAVRRAREMKAIHGQRKMATLQRAFAGLAENARMRSWQREVLRRVVAALRSKRQRCLAMAWSRWSAQRTAHRVHDLVLRRARNILGRWQLQRERAAFLHWRSVHSRASRVLQRVARVWQQQQVSGAFNTLRAHAREHRRFAAVLRRWRHRRLEEAFSTLRNRVVQGRLKAVRGRAFARVLARWQHGFLAKSFALWRERPLARKAALASLRRIWRAARARCAFGRLRGHCGRRAALEAAMRRWRRRDLVHAWRTWREVMLRRELGAMKLRRAQNVLRRWRDQSLHTAFARWRAWTAATAVRLETLVRQRTQRGMRHAWIRLEAFSRCARICNRLLQRRRDTLLRVAMQKIRDSCTTMRMRDATMRKMIRRWRTMRLRITFRKWVLRTALQRSCARALHVVVRWQTRLVRRAWARLREATHEDRKRARLSSRVIGRWRKRQALAAVLKWRSWVEAAKLVHARTHVARRVIARWGTGPLRAAFGRWALWAHHVGEHRTALKRIISAWRNRATSLAWRKWRQSTRHTIQAGALVGKIIRRWRRCALHSTMARWRTHAQMCRRLEILLQRWSARRERGRVETLRAGFSRLRRNCEAHARQRRAVKALSRWHSRRMASAFRRWTLYTASAAALTQAVKTETLRRRSSTLCIHPMLRALNRWRLARLARAWHSWCLATVHIAQAEQAFIVLQRRQNSALVRALARWKSAKLRFAFRKLQKNVAYFEAARGKRSHLRAIVARWKQRNVRAAFIVWKRVLDGAVAHGRAAASALRSLRGSLARWQKHRLRVSFGTWRRFAFDQQQAAELELRRQKVLQVFVARWTSRCKLAAFRAWCEHAESNRRARLLRHRKQRVLRVYVARWRAQSLRGSFQKWRHATRVLRIARMYLLRSTLRGALFQWRVFARAQSVKIDVIRRLSQRWRLSERDRAREALGRLRRHASRDAIIGRVLARWKSRRLRQAWTRWQRTHEHACLESAFRCRGNKQVLLHLLVSWMPRSCRKQSMAWAWSRLCVHVQQQNESHRRSRLVLARVFRRTAWSAYRRGWDRWVARTYAARAQDRLVQIAEKLRDARVKQVSFRRWVALHEGLQRKARVLARAHGRHLLRSSLELWAEMMLRARACERLARLRSLRVIKHALMLWRRMTCSSRAQAKLCFCLDRAAARASWDRNAKLLAFRCLVSHASGRYTETQYAKALGQLARREVARKESLLRSKVLSAWRVWQARTRKDRQIVRALGRIDDAWNMAHAHRAFCTWRLHALQENADRVRRQRADAAASIHEVGERARESLLQLQMTRTTSGRRRE